MGMTMREWEGLGLHQTIPAHIYSTVCQRNFVGVYCITIHSHVLVKREKQSRLFITKQESPANAKITARQGPSEEIYGKSTQGT